MVKAKKTVAVEVEAVEVVEVVEAVEAVAPSKTVATVTYGGGTREYTQELHGKDFADLAKEFAVKKGGKVS